MRIDLHLLIAIQKVRFHRSILPELDPLMDYSFGLGTGRYVAFRSGGVASTAWTVQANPQRENRNHRQSKR